jgi:DNA-binding beta-propeller fold protein YncE
VWGIAVNWAKGNVYVVDTGNKWIQQLDKNGNFIRAWGINVISGGTSGIGAVNGTMTSFEVVATSCAFLVGQEVQGEGIPVGTKVTAASGSGAVFTLTFPKPMTEKDGLGFSDVVGSGCGGFEG